MADVAIKVLAFIAGLVAAVWSFPYLNGYVFAVLAFLGAVAVGVLVGLLVDRGLRYLFGSLR